MTLALVREENVPVDELRPGDRIILPTGARVTFERTDTYDDSIVVVRWWRPAQHGEPGSRGGRTLRDELAEGCDGRYLGSLLPMLPDETVRVDHG